MTDLWIIRHAATDANLDHRLVGRSNPPLGPHGRQQAGALAEALHTAPLMALYTSPLIRARETAAAICLASPRIGAPVVEEDLQEIDLGIVDGMSSYVAYERYPDLLDRALDPATTDFAFPQGELRSHAAERFHQAICRIAGRHPGNSVAIVTHGGVLGAWLAALEGLPLGRFRDLQPQHCGIIRVCWTLRACQSPLPDPSCPGRGASSPGPLVVPIRLPI